MNSEKIMHPDGVTVIIPAYNEEKNITLTVESAIAVLKDVGIQFEIIIIDDGSTDHTKDKIQIFQKKWKQVRVHTHEKNMGFGQTIRDGISLATMGYITGLPGDNDTSPQLLKDLIKRRKEADLITAYMKNPSDRSIMRRSLSYGFIAIMNLLFGLKLRYYNGYFICKTQVLRKVQLISDGFTIFAEAKIRLLSAGYSFKEQQFEHIGRKFGESTAVSFHSLFSTFWVIVTLYYEVRLNGRR